MGEVGGRREGGAAGPVYNMPLELNGLGFGVWGLGVNLAI